LMLSSPTGTCARIWRRIGDQSHDVIQQSHPIFNPTLGLSGIVAVDRAGRSGAHCCVPGSLHIARGAKRIDPEARRFAR
jgi:hypothetical protein